MHSKIRIGSRDSALAQWQAKEVQRLLAEKGIDSEIKWIKSIGDLVQDKPLSSIGTVGVFTKALDDALLNDEIDLAVHSCKDLPSVLHTNLEIVAYLEREDARDILVSNSKVNFLDDPNFSGTIATGSVRRKAQLLAKFPKATIVGLRGNVPTRLEKLKNSNWDGAVFAYAGLKRLRIQPEHYAFLDFMVPAPAQGVVAVIGHNNAKTRSIGKLISNSTSHITTSIEREFLRRMEGGCISPIGARAQIDQHWIELTISVLSTYGHKKIEFTERMRDWESWKSLANKAFQKAKELGAVTLIEEIEKDA